MSLPINLSEDSAIHRRRSQGPWLYGSVAGIHGADAEGAEHAAGIRGGARASEIVVIGAHYDTVYDCPGADDNTSGVAGLLELPLAQKLASPARSGSWPLSMKSRRGSRRKTWAAWSMPTAHKLKENIVAAVSLETIGMYSDAEGGQQYPDGFKSLYPSRGNFIAFIGDLSSHGLVRDAVRSFRSAVNFPSEGSSVPGAVPGVGWSDHWSFWPRISGDHGHRYRAFRNPNYHRPTDTPDTLDYDRMAKVVHGLVRVATDLGK